MLFHWLKISSWCVILNKHSLRSSRCFITTPWWYTASLPVKCHPRDTCLPMCVSFGGPSSVEPPPSWLQTHLMIKCPHPPSPHITWHFHFTLSFPYHVNWVLYRPPHSERAQGGPSASLLSTNPTPLWAFLGESRSKLCFFNLFFKGRFLQ